MATCTKCSGYFNQKVGGTSLCPHCRSIPDDAPTLPNLPEVDDKDTNTIASIYFCNKCGCNYVNGCPSH